MHSIRETRTFFFEDVLNCWRRLTFLSFAMYAVATYPILHYGLRGEDPREAQRGGFSEHIRGGEGR